MRRLFFHLSLYVLWLGALRKVRAEQPYVIAITGTIGKTTVKEAIAEVLTKSNHLVVKTAGNMGSDMGLPLSLLGFTAQPDGFLEWLSAMLLSFFPPIKKTKERPYYVLEFSADKPGDIAFLAKRIPPDVAVLTAITPVHMALYPDFQDLIKEKTSLLDGLKPGGYVVLNHDDPEQLKIGDGRNDVVWYGLSPLPNKLEGCFCKNLKRSDDLYLTAELVYIKPGRTMDTIGKSQPQTMVVQSKVATDYQFRSLLGAAVVGLREGLSPIAIKNALEKYEIPNGRGKFIAGQKDIVIFDDTYNASPDAVKQGLQSLRELARGKRVVAILGRMNELGKMSKEAHSEIGRVAAKNVDFLVAVGQFAGEVCAGAEKGGMAKGKFIDFSTTEHLIDKLEQVVQRGDLVYVKGSQNGVRLERVVKQLMLHPKDASKHLVRQHGNWLKTP